MTLDQTNYLNVVLMLVAAVLGYFLPLELFVFAYAILGPAHYLTQISWLHDHQYFSTSRVDPIILVLVGAVVTVTAYLGYGFVSKEFGNTVLVGGTFFAAFAFAHVRRTSIKIAVVVGAIALALLSTRSATWVLIAAHLISTLIHVYVFTGLFIAYGNIKSRSTSGWIALAVFLLVPVAYILDSSPPSTRQIGRYFVDSVQGFGGVVDALEKVLGLPRGWGTTLTIMRFTAFAYTYHYLNWFSKTKIIGWAKISKARGATIVVLWAMSVILYGINFHWGLNALLFLSLVHVFLEFPLNHKTIAAIAGAVKGAIVRPAGARS